MKTEIGDRVRFNHITTMSLSTTLSWVQNDCMVISWIINNIDHDFVEYFLDYTTSARDLWTIIHFILRPVLLPPVDETIQCEVVRGRNMVEKTSSEFNPSQDQNPDLKINPENSRQANLENPDSKLNSFDNGPHRNLENKGERERKNFMLRRR